MAVVLDSDQSLEALLAWYVAAGADEAIGDEPVDRFAEAERRQAAARAAAVPQAAPRPVAAQPAAVVQRLGPDSPAAAIAEARAAAAAAKTLDELRQAVTAFEGCALKRTATNTVFAGGGPSG